MTFFRQFPKIDYDFNREGSITQMVDIFRSVRPLPTFVDEFSGYKFYEIADGERPDIVSQRLYGTSKYYWTFFVVNDFLHDGYRSWPLSASDLHAYIEKEYKGKAIETILNHLNLSTVLPIFIGDDLTDESGFTYINQQSGLSIKVGPGETQAKYRLKDINSVADFLLLFQNRIKSLYVKNSQNQNGEKLCLN